MANLTTEYLDKKFTEIGKRFNSIDKHFDNTDKKIEGVKNELKKDIENLAVMTARGFEEMDISDRVEKLEKKMGKLSEALHL